MKKKILRTVFYMYTQQLATINLIFRPSLNIYVS